MGAGSSRMRRRSSSGPGLVVGAVGDEPSELDEPEELDELEEPLSAEGRGESSTWVPEYWSMNSATFLASSPVTMFCGMTAPEAPPLWIA